MPNSPVHIPKPTRQAGLARLEEFTVHMGHDYAHKRNFDYGPEADIDAEIWRDNVSRLSPYIRHRLITEQEVLEAAIEAHGPQAADKFVAEVLWRGYFRGWLEQRPDVWKACVEEHRKVSAKLKVAGGLRKSIEKAELGETGIDAFDYWARELVSTGYLHNHARMWFASIWIFTLKLPWTMGADFFLRHLLDGDAASNTLSWRWVAGLHTKGKTYLATTENIGKFSDGRFAPSGLAIKAVPLDEDHNFKLRPFKSPPVPPKAAKFALLVHEEDCHPESLTLPDVPSLIIAAAAPEAKSHGEMSENVCNFSLSAVEDAATRAGAHFGCDVVFWDQGTRLKKILHDAGLERLLSSWIPVGPLNDAIGGEVRDANVKWVMREYDKAIWPLATKSFFAVKKKAPDALRAIGLAL